MIGEHEEGPAADYSWCCWSWTIWKTSCCLPPPLPPTNGPRHRRHCSHGSRRLQCCSPSWLDDGSKHKDRKRRKNAATRGTEMRSVFDTELYPLVLVGRNTKKSRQQVDCSFRCSDPRPRSVGQWRLVCGQGRTDGAKDDRVEDDAKTAMMMMMVKDKPEQSKMKQPRALVMAVCFCRKAGHVSIRT
jgi:hypothetical protein